MPDAPGKINPAIVVTNLGKVFGSFTAVEALSFNIKRGEIFGLLGPNGAGKSTTIRMLCGLLSSTSGSASVGGFDINTSPEQVRQNIGYMSQKFSLYRDLTVMENLLFFGGVYGLDRATLDKRATAVLAETGLSDHTSQLTNTLSGAIQQRLALACAIVHEPAILFLDEPTSGVDPISRRKFWDLIRQMTDRGVTVLVTTHFMDEAEFCARIGFINAGRLMALGTPPEVKSRSVNEDLFEITAPNASAAKELLAKAANILDVSYYGSKIHAFCRSNTCTETNLIETFRRAGMDIPGVRKVSPTLEDAFVRMAKQTTEAHQ